jgi:anti-sigma B factor antagonist
LKFEVEELTDRRAVIHLKGRLDANSAEITKARLKSIVNNGIDELVLDMRDVHFIDSSGLSVLVSSYRVVNESGGAFILAGTVPQVEMALQMTRLNRVFPVYKDVEIALASFEE